MTKLSSQYEQAIRQLEDIEEADDLNVAWAEREPYESRLLRLWGALREEREKLKKIMEALDPRHRLKVREYRRLVRLFPRPKCKKGKYRRRCNALDFAVDDAKRLRRLLPQEAAEQIAIIAAERHIRFVNHCCTVDKLDNRKDLTQDWAEVAQDELRKVADEVYEKWQHPSGKKRSHAA
jgi:hypothetical protein